MIPSNELFSRNTIGESLLFINSDSNTFGEYFGASLLALDINNDTIDDLIIGAPYYSNEQSREIGRIYVYMSDKATNILKFYFQILPSILRLFNFYYYRALESIITFMATKLVVISGHHFPRLT